MPPISLGIGLSLSMQGRGGRGWRDYDLFETGSGFLYDFSRADTLFQEATGQTPAGLDQNVGLALDISKWGGKTLAQILAGQPELVTNGTFDTATTGWSSVSSAVLSIVSNRLRVTNTGAGFGRASQAITCVVGRRYWVAGDFVYSATNGGIRIGTTSGGAETLLPSAFSSSRSFSASFVATATTHYVTLATDTATTSGVYTEYDNISIKEIPGNHASQATSAARPVRKAGLTRYDGSDDNLLTTLVPGTAMTLAFDYVVPATLSGVQFIMGAGTGTTRLYAGFNTSGQMIGLVGAQDSSVIKGATDFRGQRVRGFLIADGTTVQLIAGSATEYSAAQNGSNVSAYPMRVGAGNNVGSATGFSNGDLFRALAINRALTPAEITKLTNAWSA